MGRRKCEKLTVAGQRWVNAQADRHDELILLMRASLHMQTAYAYVSASDYSAELSLYAYKYTSIHVNIHGYLSLSLSIY